MSAWAAIIAFIIQLYDRVRIRLSYRKGWIDAAKQGEENVKDIRDLINSDDPVSVSDNEIIRRE